MGQLHAVWIVKVSELDSKPQWLEPSLWSEITTELLLPLYRSLSFPSSPTYVRKSTFLTGQKPFVLLKTAIKKSNIHATFPIPYLWDRLNETQWLVLFVISGNNLATFQHKLTQLDRLYQGSYSFCAVFSLHHVIALVSALSARETTPMVVLPSCGFQN